jgi:hypothetical protein
LFLQNQIRSKAKIMILKKCYHINNLSIMIVLIIKIKIKMILKIILKIVKNKSQDFQLLKNKKFN